MGAGFNPDLTGLENVYFNGAVLGFTQDEMDKKIDKILDFADIGKFIHQKVKMYSSGMFVRLAFSVAVQVDPDLLIVDEASMIDTLLMFSMLKAVPPDAVLILVGDVNQLPSVGAGNVLSDVIESLRTLVILWC